MSSSMRQTGGVTARGGGQPPRARQARFSTNLATNPGMFKFLAGMVGVPVKTPKFIDPKTHAILDYATAGMFFAAAYSFRRRNPRAAALAMINGSAVLGASLFTDYPGGVWRRLSFKTHGRLDGLQAMLAGSGPALLGFSKQREARLFYAQAGVESQVMAATDFDAMERRPRTSPSDTGSGGLSTAV
ncbi:MAG: hypothetical protein ABI051_07760 [Vicinamibacterales bacterium]